MRKKELYEKVIAYFGQAMPVAETELHYSNPFELLIAVILSAQCTDKRVNLITPPLFRDFPTPEALAASTPEVIFEYIRSVSYPNNKAKHLVGMAERSVQQGGHGRRYPRIPGEPPHRTGTDELHHTARHRKVPDEVFTQGNRAYRPPLAHPARTLRLHRPEPEMRAMRTERLVQGIAQGRTGKNVAIHKPFLPIKYRLSQVGTHGSCVRKTVYLHKSDGS